MRTSYCGTGQFLHADLGAYMKRMRDRSKFSQAIWALLDLFGVNVHPRRGLDGLRGIPGFFRDLHKFNCLVGHRDTRAAFRNLYPILGDRYESAANVDSHYFYQDIWAAQRVIRLEPERHYDIGSRLDGFVAHVLCKLPVTVIDIRPNPVEFDGLTFIEEDATSLAQFATNSIESLSSLHAAEHFGLGRYGDDIDPGAHFKFMASLMRVLKPGGRLLFSVPSGVERVHFNAYRVLSTATVLETFSELTLLSFSAIDDSGRYFENCEMDLVQNAQYACGLYEFTK